MKRTLDLFKVHPVVRRIYDLNESRIAFTRFAERIESGEKPVLKGYGVDFYREMADEAEQQMFQWMSLLRIDGKSLIDF